MDGTLDRTMVQNHKLPFYDALRSTTNDVLDTISEKYTAKEFLECWAKINEQKLSSPSGRYVGLYKAMAIAVTEPEMREVIRQISNSCMTSGYILNQWQLVSDAMLPKKLNNCRIDSLGAYTRWRQI